jgi:transcriptional regulator GlxA family with amidase domain
MPKLFSPKLLRILTYALAAITAPLLVGAAGAGVRMYSILKADPTPPPYTGALPAPPPHDPAKRTAVLIAANTATEGTDFLAPYEVIGASGAFNLYAVAPERRITPLFPGAQTLRGVDFVPHYSFAEYDRAIVGDPDLIVIPYLPYDQAPEYKQIMAWVRKHAGPRTILLSICAGAKNLADTGLLAGHSATTHHNAFAVMEKTHPEVRLVRGVRYVEDGNIISSAGITAGVDATLFTLKRMLGREVALSTAQQLGYPYARFLDDPTYDLPEQQIPGILPNAYRIGSSQLGVALYPGISEIALGSVVDTYPHSAVVTIHTIAPERTVVRSRHGLALVPRWSFQDAPHLDRIILPGATASADTATQFEGWSRERYGFPIERMHQGGGYAYDVTLNDIARRDGSAVANWAVYGLEYPIGRATVAAPIYPLGLIVRPIALGLLGLALVISRRRTARKQPAAAIQSAAV